MTEMEYRTVPDRRKKPTPALSRYTFFGRRRMFRRKEDQGRGGYVDRYSSSLFFFLVLLLGLNILDIIFTLMIIDNKGWEVNPIVRSVMDIHGDGFWIWKFGMISFSLTLLCLHSKFRMAKTAILALSSIYFILILYELYVLFRL